MVSFVDVAKKTYLCASVKVVCGLVPCRHNRHLYSPRYTIMLVYFKKGATKVYAVDTARSLTDSEVDRLSWLFGGARRLVSSNIKQSFIGPRREMVTPWSTNAVEICQNMGIDCIRRIEQFDRADKDTTYDRMLQRYYNALDAHVFDVDTSRAPIRYIEDIAAYNVSEGLALSADEVEYLQGLAKRMNRPLTDSEVFGFSQVNSEHCRHKIFNGTFVIDGKEQPLSLFKLIKKTSKTNPNGLVSAYKDNVAFVKGPRMRQFAPVSGEYASYFEEKNVPTVLSLKAETHNFPTTVEPFNGAATGTGGEIRDRLGGGRASLPLAGTAVYMTSYPRLNGLRPWELMMNPRVWLYQTPAEILIKASNGASDFGNKYGQPLICGSVLTFEYSDDGIEYAYDKVVMLAGGVGYARARDAVKGHPHSGESVIVMGGDNYRIGMGGGAVSSVATGQYANAIELNAVQRANPEMQKRVANVIRALSESDTNPIVSIHDHGAGGHLNALSELVEETGGYIDIDRLPVGDPTLSDKEIIGNESQERMGMVVRGKDVERIRRIAERERAPMYEVGHTTADHRFVFGHGGMDDSDRQESGPIDLAMADMFGSSPRTVMTDNTVVRHHASVRYDVACMDKYIADVLSLEAVACKDWLTNKVDRSVTGRVARQQCQGALQLPLSDCGVVSIDFTGRRGIATSIGHAPQAALCDAAAGSRMAIAEALTNIVGADSVAGLRSVSLSANWMWPCRNPGEDAALYRAVESCSEFACALGVNIPTGKDSLSMTQKYPDGRRVMAPGTVIISAAAPVRDIRRTLSPVLVQKKSSTLYYIDFAGDTLRLGGSALAQTMGLVGNKAPEVDAVTLAHAFGAVQTIVRKRKALAMHDVSAGGLVTTLLEMAFANTSGGLEIDLSEMAGSMGGDLVSALFAENAAVVMQVDNGTTESVEAILNEAGVRYFAIGHPVTSGRTLEVKVDTDTHSFDIDALRSIWYEPSYRLDCLQSGEECAAARRDNLGHQPLRYIFPSGWKGSKEMTIRPEASVCGRPRAAIIRDKGINGEREMAYSLYLAGFDVKDVCMTDLMSGAETLEDIRMIVFCGGFSNSDVLGSAKGWASGFRWNEKARKTLEAFYARRDTLSLGVCNGCQLMIELGLIAPEAGERMPRMEHNRSHKFESQYLGIIVPQNNTVMFGGLSGSRLGIWVAHGEGRFNLGGAAGVKNFNVIAKYAYRTYPGNPNGSDGAVAGIASPDGRHVAIMPHLERAIFPWQCGHYPRSRRNDAVTPWLAAFRAAFEWCARQ